MRIAVIGASNKKRKYSNRALRLYRKEGYDVIPVNPNEEDVEGIPCYRSILDIPKMVDIASFYVPPEIGRKIVPQIIKAGVRVVYLNPGADAEDIVESLESAGISAMRVCTPF
jgi:predicted CoA-binding protein